MGNAAIQLDKSKGNAPGTTGAYAVNAEQEIGGNQHLEPILTEAVVSAQTQPQPQQVVVASAIGLAVGTRVECNYGGQGTFYPGVISAINSNGTVSILYDDGNQESWVPRNMLRLTQPIHPGVHTTQTVHPGVHTIQPAYTGVQTTQPAHPGVQTTQPVHCEVHTTQPAHPGVQTTQPVHPGVQTTQPVHSGVQTTQPAYPRVHTTQPVHPGVQTNMPLAPHRSDLERALSLSRKEVARSREQKDMDRALKLSEEQHMIQTAMYKSMKDLNIKSDDQLLEEAIRQSALSANKKLKLASAENGGIVLFDMIKARALPEEILARATAFFFDPEIMSHLVDADGNSLFMAAVTHGHQSFVSRFRQHCDMSAQNFHGDTMLHMAVVKSAHRSVAFIRSLVEWGAPVNTQNSEGRTALHVAATGASSPVVALLCECGADVTLKDSNGFTPVTWAFRNGAEALGEVMTAMHDRHKNNGTA